MRAQDLMSHPAITCHVNDDLNVPAQKMWDLDIGAVAVVDDNGKLTGMLTDRDICMAAYTRGRALEDLLVNGAMSMHVVSAHADTGIAAVEDLMAKHQIRRIPIVDAAGKPIGMVSLNDLAIESAQPDTAMRKAPTKITYTLAAICRRRTTKSKAA